MIERGFFMEKIIQEKNCISPASDFELLLTAHRIIVLVPDFSINEIALGRKIWDLARSTGSNILFLGTVQTIDEEWHTLQRVAALFAVTQDRRIHVESRLEFGCSWQKAVRGIWQPGDVILCLENHTVRGTLFGRTSLAGKLAHELNLPVYCLPGSFEQQAIPGGTSVLFSGQITRVY
jgi:hypothetical protein